MIYKYKLITEPEQINIDIYNIIKKLIKTDCGELIYNQIKIKTLNNLIFINYLIDNDYILYVVQSSLFSLNSLPGSYCKIIKVF